jgi:hypothetical protein
LRLFPIGVVTLAAVHVLWVTPREASAQCDSPSESSCYTCHEDTHPVSERGEWHTIHAGKDCCWNCHGGNDQVEDKDLAHVGLMLNPLEDTYLSCHACHPDDYQSRADRFARALGVKPGSSEPLTQTIAMAPGGGSPIVQPIVPAPSNESALPWLWLMVLVTGALLLGLVLLQRRLSRQHRCWASYGHPSRESHTAARRVGYYSLRHRPRRVPDDRTDSTQPFTGANDEDSNCHR